MNNTAMTLQKLFKADVGNWEVREVTETDGQKDSEGAPVIANQHFLTKAEAIQRLSLGARAMVTLANRDIQAAEQRLNRAHEYAAKAVTATARVMLLEGTQ